MMDTMVHIPDKTSQPILALVVCAEAIKEIVDDATIGGWIWQARCCQFLRT